MHDLLEKLQSEASAESAHKEWCDSQLKKSSLRLKHKKQKVSQVKAELEEITGQISTMADELSQLAADQEQLTKDMAEYTEIRTKEHKENVATIENAQFGQAAVKKA